MCCHGDYATMRRAERERRSGLRRKSRASRADVRSLGGSDAGFHTSLIGRIIALVGLSSEGSAVSEG